MAGKTIVAIFHALSLLLPPENEKMNTVIQIKNFIQRFVDYDFFGHSVRKR